MSLKKKIIFTALVVLPILAWILFFTSADIVKFNTREYFWFDLFEHSSIQLTNSYIFLIYKVLVGVGLILFGLYTFFLKKEVKWYYFALELVFLILVNLIPYNISKDLLNNEFVAPWIYGTLGLLGAAGIVVSLELLTRNEKAFFAGVAKCFGYILLPFKRLFGKKEKNEELKEEGHQTK
jgi:hypothetical protein